MKKWIFKTDRPGLGGQARKEEQHWSGENNDAENDMMTMVVLIVVLMMMRMMLQVCRMRSNGTNKKVEQSSWNGPHRVCKRNIESICIGVGEEWGCKERYDLDDDEADGDDDEDDDDDGKDVGDDDGDDGDDEVILQKEHWKYLYGRGRRIELQGTGWWSNGDDDDDDVDDGDDESFQKEHSKYLSKEGKSNGIQGKGSKICWSKTPILDK